MRGSNDMIIGNEDVMEALVGGFEVLMVDKDKSHKYGVSCIPLSKEPFSKIEEFVREEAPNRIYLQIERYIPEEEGSKNEA